MVEINMKSNVEDLTASGASVLAFVSHPEDRESDLAIFAVGEGNLIESIEDVMKGCGSLVRQITTDPDELQILAHFLSKELKKAVLQGSGHDEVLKKKIFREEES